MYVFYLPSTMLKVYKFLKRRKDNSNYVCGVKCITTCTNYWCEPKKAPRDTYFH